MRTSSRHMSTNTWDSFKTTGIWLGLRIFAMPLIFFAIFYSVSHGSDTALNQGGLTLQRLPAVLGDDGNVLSDSLATLSNLDKIVDFGGSGSSGQLLGFGVGSAGASTGAKWARP